MNKMNIYQDRQFAQDYDLFYHTGKGESVDRIEKGLIRDLLKRVNAHEMLELGCGTGHWTHFFSEEGFQITALDESTEMLEQAQKKKISNTHWIKANASRLPFPDHHFTLITAITLFEFVDDIDALFNEIYRVLKPDGFLIAGWLNALSEIGKQKETSSTFRHATLYTPEEIEKHLSLFGSTQFSYGVYYDRDFNILDDRKDNRGAHPSFIATIVQKKKESYEHRY